MWNLNAYLYDNIAEWWGIDIQGMTMYRVVKKLSNVQKWNKSSFGNIFQRMDSLERELDEIQQQIQTLGYDPHLMDKEVEVLSKLHDIISKEEEYWKQWSRAIWLKSEDMNTQFFHMTTLKHRSSNRIKWIYANNQWVDKQEEMSQEAIHFFSSLLEKEGQLDVFAQENLLMRSLIACPGR